MINEYKKYYIIIWSSFLLFPQGKTQAMDHSSLTSKEKITLSLVIGGLLVTSYGFYRFLTWIYPPTNKMGKSSSHQSFQNIISGGDIEVRQTGSSSSSKANVQIGYANNKFSLNQSGGRTNITQKKLTKNGITFNQLDISLKSQTPLKYINVLEITQLNIYQAYSEGQLISFQYPVQDCPDFSLILEDDSLSYQSPTKQLANNCSLEVWVYNKYETTIRRI